MTDLILRAETPEALALACPWLRGVGWNDEPIWLMSTEEFAFYPFGAIIITEGVYDDDLNEITAPVYDMRFHAALRCRTEEVANRVPKSVIAEFENPPFVWF